MHLTAVILSLAMIGLVGIAYAQPLEQVDYTVIDIENSVATVELSWNNDDSVAEYEAGCVSCIPNVVKNTTNDTIVLNGITSLGGHALLFVVAYDHSGEILGAKQVLLDVK